MGGQHLRSHSLSGENSHVVLAAALYVQCRGGEFTGSQDGRRLFFTFPSGRPLHRTDIEGSVKLAARAVGLPHRRANTHSLRMEVASALYAATRSIAAVRRFGRRMGNSADPYVFVAEHNARRDAQSMVRAAYRFLL